MCSFVLRINCSLVGSVEAFQKFSCWLIKPTLLGELVKFPSDFTQAENPLKGVFFVLHINVLNKSCVICERFVTVVRWNDLVPLQIQKQPLGWCENGPHHHFGNALCLKDLHEINFFHVAIHSMDVTPLSLVAHSAHLLLFPTITLSCREELSERTCEVPSDEHRRIGPSYVRLVFGSVSNDMIK